MSIEALSWAFNLELPSSGAKITLLALANYANEAGEAYPSQKAMAEKTCLCERAIRTHLVTLEGLGIISRVARTRSNGSFTSDLFKLHIGAKAQRQILPAADSAVGRNCQTQRQILPQPAADSAGPEPSLTTTITKSNQKNNAPATRLPKDWMPSADDVRFCRTERPDLNVKTLADGFRDYWIAVAGAKGKKLDWPATWRNWVRNQKQAAPPRYESEKDRGRREVFDVLCGGKQDEPVERDITGFAERVD